LSAAMLVGGGGQWPFCTRSNGRLGGRKNQRGLVILLFRRTAVSTTRVGMVAVGSDENKCMCNRGRSSSTWDGLFNTESAAKTVFGKTFRDKRGNAFGTKNFVAKTGPSKCVSVPKWTMISK
jgi:hypothetical protein